jgi:hypothetical protein
VSGGGGECLSAKSAEERSGDYPSSLFQRQASKRHNSIRRIACLRGLVPLRVRSQVLSLSVIVEIIEIVLSDCDKLSQLTFMAQSGTQPKVP